MSKQKPSQRLADNVDSYGVYDHNELAQDFKEQVGDDAPWPSHTVSYTKKEIKRRISQRKKQPSWGWEIAISLARTYVPKYEYTGRISLYHDALEVLKNSGN
jgi:hypothetical protein